MFIRLCVPVGSYPMKSMFLFCFVKEYFNFDESTKNAALATILHPAFKLRWVAREDLATVEKLKKWFFTTLQEY
jgi:hypothetical protein